MTIEFAHCHLTPHLFIEWPSMDRYVTSVIYFSHGSKGIIAAHWQYNINLSNLLLEAKSLSLTTNDFFLLCCNLFDLKLVLFERTLIGLRVRNQWKCLRYRKLPIWRACTQHLDLFFTLRIIAVCRTAMWSSPVVLTEMENDRDFVNHIYHDMTLWHPLL